MKITTRALSNVTVVDICGRLDTQTSGSASEEMARIAEGSIKILLNFEKLEFLSSAGLRVLLRLAKQLNGMGGAIKICGPSRTVREILDISGFGNFMDIHESESDAFNAF